MQFEDMQMSFIFIEINSQEPQSQITAVKIYIIPTNK